MTERELDTLGVQSKAHRNALMDAIKQLPALDMDPSVPVSKNTVQINV